MALQWAGFWMALATFVSIWWGHVGVRWLEAHSSNIWPPTIALLLGGIGLNVFSLFAPNLIVSGVSSIIGITLMWDALEMWRQSQRIVKHHAPANPNNPRHAALLAQGKATTEDQLDREPQGFPIAPYHKERKLKQPSHPASYRGPVAEYEEAQA